MAGSTRSSAPRSRRGSAHGRSPPHAPSCESCQPRSGPTRRSSERRSSRSSPSSRTRRASWPGRFHASASRARHHDRSRAPQPARPRGNCRTVSGLPRRCSLRGRYGRFLRWNAFRTMRRTTRMGMRKLAAIVGMATMVVAACGGGAATSAPSAGGASVAPSAGASSSAAAGGDCTVGVSWNNFQQPRWAAHDQPNIKDTVEAGGGTYIDADANLSNEQQLTDVDTLISKGAKVLILLAQDNKAILPALQKAKDAGIPVIAYDRLIEDPDILYITFDNVLVGKAEAQAILDKVPTGNYVLIKGDPGDPNAATFLPQGWDEAGLKDKVASGDIKILNGPDGTFTDAWKTEKAQSNMEAIIDEAVADGTKIDAILAENDSTALGVVGALTAKSYGFPPLSGQDGDPANLNNVALGKQYVDVFKQANELGKAAGAAALKLCEDPKNMALTLPDGLLDTSVAPTAGLAAKAFTTPGGTSVQSFILQPTPLTAENLQVAVDAGQISKEDLCKGVDAATAPPACK